MRERRFLIVTDGKAGHENQSKALCAAMNRPFDLLRVEYKSPIQKALAYLYDRIGVYSWSLFHADFKPRKKSQKYEAVVATGSTAFYPGKCIAKSIGVPICAILTPKGFRMNFDCILAPSFDRPPELENVIQIPINLTQGKPEFYRAAAQEFEQKHHPRKPGIGVVIGGPNDFSQMDVQWMRKQLNLIFELTGTHERWVTTSRRTPKAIEKLVDEYPFDYKLIYSRDKYNPIPAFVYLCDRLFVTADSTGMISEAVTQGKAKVEVVDNLKDRKSKFNRFVESLEKYKAVHRFDGTLGFAQNKIDLAPVFADAEKLMFPDGLAQKKKRKRKAKAIAP